MQKNISSSEYLMKQQLQNIKSNQQEQCLIQTIQNDDQLSPVRKNLKKNTFDQTTNQSQKYFIQHKARPKIANSVSISISNVPEIENNLSNDLIKKVASKQQEQFIELFPMEMAENENNDPKQSYTGKLQEKLQIQIQSKATEAKKETKKLQDRFKVTKLQINPIEKKPSSTGQLNKRIIEHTKSNVASSPYQNKTQAFIHSPSKNSQFKMKFSYYTPMSNDELLVKLNSSQNSSFSSTKKISPVMQFHPTKTHQLNLSIKLNNFGDFINDNNHKESPKVGNQNQEFRKNTIRLNSATEIINKAKLLDQLYL